MSNALVIVHLSSLDSYAEKYGVAVAQDLADRLSEAILTHAGPVFIIDQRWPYTEGISDPRVNLVQHVQLARDIKWSHFDDRSDDWDIYLEHLRKALLRAGVKNIILGGMWYSPEGAGCVSDAQTVLVKNFMVRVNPRLVGCIPTGGKVSS